MATKKAKVAAAPAQVPAELLIDASNKFVARAKIAAAKKWSLVRAESLAGGVHVAWYLLALSRKGDARGLADEIADAVTGGEGAVWWEAAGAIALAARLAREAGDEPRRAALVARLVERPAVPAEPAAALAKAIAEADKDVRSAEVDPSQKFACEGFARGCARAAYFRETAAEGRYEPGSVDVTALERTIEGALDGLRAQLGGR
ncbi:MAG: hypothetical protein JWO86_336 [Myxococcaceae bacterium]|jgi:hypothetical protein|nr:hypothetical protein [Myxococcaceae bacterium]MEA2751285.1 hypothetical protein [Myxococcales bacterium]